jgi:Ca2+-binding RTX toxin-like protein
LKRTATLLLMVMVAALVLASGVALAINTINCQAGGNPCYGTPDADVMNGTTGPDDMRSLEGGDTLNAGDEIDSLNGGKGPDTLNGEANNDQLNGGRGSDTLSGAAGDDSYLFANRWGKDTATDNAAASQFDRLSFNLVTEPVSIDIVRSASRPEARSGRNTLNFDATLQIAEVDGGSAGDTIRGDAGNDFLNGNEGGDTIVGRAGEDTLVGVMGADTLRAADNRKDELDCGGGNDTVFFDKGLDTFLNAADCEDKRPS